jgi:hypothetical protein
MSLTPEQKNIVASWVAAGDSLSAVQKKLSGQFKLSMTYMDVRFLVDDLDLTLKDPAPPPAAAASVPPPSPSGPAARPDFPNRTPLDEDEAFDPASDDRQTKPTPMPDELDDDVMPEADAATSVRVEVDNVTLVPGALASGSVTFGDGVTGKWIVDNYGRPGFTQISQPDYRPTAADADAFMRQLSAVLQKRGY